MHTHLAYTYACTARIMNAGGYTDAEIKAFLVKHQNPSGYISAKLIPAPRKLAK